jgi:hypothetical protein
MSTSKLQIDPAHVAAAEQDDWAKFVCARRHIESLTFFVDTPPTGFFLSYQRFRQDREPLFRK